MNARAIECPWCGSGAFPKCCIVAEHEWDLEQRVARRQAAAKNAAREDARIGVDFIARLADAWDYRGDHVFRASGIEHRALLQMAQLPQDLWTSKWAELTGDQRQALLFSAKAVIQLARQCAWIFGEGQGAR
jgi:hypothetical protein